MSDEFKPRHMMATTATHQLGDLSAIEPDIALVYGEDGDDWIGEWVEGFGFFDVRFPKSTTRDLTEDEIDQYEDRDYVLAGRREPFKIKRVTDG